MIKTKSFKHLLLKSLLIPSSFIMPVLLAIACKDTKPEKKLEAESESKTDAKSQSETENQPETPALLSDGNISTANLEKLPIILKSVSGFTNFENLSIDSVGDDFKELKFATTNKEDDKQINITVKNKKYINNDKETSLNQGKLIFTLEISAKNSPDTKIEKDIEISGFRKSRSSQINLNWADRFAPGSKDEFIKYFSKDNYERFQSDSEKYLNALESQLAYSQGKSSFDLASWRPEVPRTEDQIKKYDTKAKELKLDTYINALKKGFTMPIYSENGEVKGLKLLDQAEIPKGPAWWDIINRNENQTNGLARYIPNEKYKDAALQTYSVFFSWPATIDDISPEYLKPFLESKKPGVNPMQQTARGTMWILDYQIPENQTQQPTKWYFGTNNHVLEEYRKDATNFSLTVLKPNVGIRTKLKTAKGATDESYITAAFDRNSLEPQAKNDHEDKKADYISPSDYGIPGIRIVYRATDYLNSSPKDFLVDQDKNNEKYKDLEEFLDFGVIEIDFSKFKVPEGYSSRDEFIKTITNDYYNKKDKQIKFLKTSYLTDYSKADTKLADLDNKKSDSTDQLFIVGYPQATNDYFLDKYEDSYDYKLSKLGYSLWMNSDSSFYNSLSNDENNPDSQENKKANKGNYLSLNIGYRSFGDKPGLTDAFIAAPKVGKALHKSTVMADPIHIKKVTKEVEENGKKVTKDLGELPVANKKSYIGSGLLYLPRHYAPGGGASGSSIRNQNNELVGIYFVSNDSAKTGLAAAFRSEGFDYKGLYGKYNLPQYDLIYGGGKDQKTSFRQALQTIYGDDFKTSLFPNSVKQIPEEYKFNNSNSNTQK